MYVVVIFVFRYMDNLLLKKKEDILDATYAGKCDVSS